MMKQSSFSHKSRFRYALAMVLAVAVLGVACSQQFESELMAPKDPFAARVSQLSGKTFVMDSLTTAPVPVNLIEIQRKIGYPEAARENGIQGSVTYRVFVDKKGKYLDHEIIDSPSTLLSDAVARELPNLRFTPAVSGKGKNVPSWVVSVMKFKLLE